MTEEKLQRALEIKQEILDIENFISALSSGHVKIYDVKTDMMTDVSSENYKSIIELSIRDKEELLREFAEL